MKGKISHVNIVWTMTNSKTGVLRRRSLRQHSLIYGKLFGCENIMILTLNCDLLIFIVIFLLYKILDISAFVSV